MKEIEKNAQIALGKFVILLSSQNKLVTAEDMIPKMSYTYVSSSDGLNATRCMLWSGVEGDDLLRKYAPDLVIDVQYDAQLNIEIQPFASSKTFVFIFFHKKGERFDNLESWEKE